MENWATDFGYPTRLGCESCKGIHRCDLTVGPYYRKGSHFRVMLIGQDPTIRRKPERVNSALMLDLPNSQLSRWLHAVFGGSLSDVTIYATNLVKCRLPHVPIGREGRALLEKSFRNCREHLVAEVKQYQPHAVLAFGESAHALFAGILDGEPLPFTMQGAFTGHFHDVELAGRSFKYSPCLHIQTFRVAQTYGRKVPLFMQAISELLDDDSN